MIQTTLFNYFQCNGAIQPIVKKVSSFKQTSIYDHFNRIPKKKNFILNYFKPKNKVQEKEEQEKVFDLILVDINESSSILSTMKCVKKNMYDPDSKYIAISYRWGELNEQLLKTPDYTAHITSFNLVDLKLLCKSIKSDPELKEIPYLWIDAISVDQHNHSRKKDTILKMNQIYKKATYILAVPDLHYSYLLKHPANKEILDLIRYDYYKTIYKEIANNKYSSTENSINNDNTESSITTNSIRQQQQHTNNNGDQYSFIQNLTSKKLINKNNELKIEKEMKEKENELQQRKQELKKIYQYLAYLIEDWSNRAWVISEYHIAKEKYMKHGTPLKYWFISLHYYRLRNQPFFSYYFNDNDQQQSLINNINDDKSNNVLNCRDVIDSKTFNQFLKSRFMQRSHLEMILDSNAARNKDRFHAILPSWNEYHRLIINRNTISEWNITDMTSVRLKLYEIMDDGDLWNKASLLKACSRDFGEIILPSFATYNNKGSLILVEKCDYNNVIYKEFEEKLLKNTSIYRNKEKVTRIQQFINEYKTNSKAIWTENLASIQYEQRRYCVSVKSNTFFIKKDDYQRDSLQNKLLLDDDDEIYYVFLPFFTFAIPDYIDDPLIYINSSSIFLVGNKNKNKWALTNGRSYHYKSEHFCSDDDYTFNIY
ncbi:unnamed protein product [Cunninghamella blakesleeana]